MLKLILWGVVVSIAVAAGAVFYPKWLEERDGGRSACLRTIKRATVACLMYSEQNDERLPLAFNWMDALSPHLDDPLVCSRVREGEYGYAYNDRFSGVPLSKAQEKTDILIFESTKLLRNEHDSAESIPSPGRHKGRSYLAYTDSTDLMR